MEDWLLDLSPPPRLHNSSVSEILITSIYTCITRDLSLPSIHAVNHSRNIPFVFRSFIQLWRLDRSLTIGIDARLLVLERVQKTFIHRRVVAKRFPGAMLFS